MATYKPRVKKWNNKIQQTYRKTQLKWKLKKQLETNVFIHKRKKRVLIEIKRQPKPERYNVARERESTQCKKQALRNLEPVVATSTTQEDWRWVNCN